DQPSAASLDTFRRSLDARWIEEALEATGTATLRKRRLPAQQVIWLVLGMALVRDRPIAEVVSHLDLALPGQGGTAVVAPSSVAQARQRLGPEPLEWLFNKSAGTWASASARDDEGRGLALSCNRPHHASRRRSRHEPRTFRTRRGRSTRSQRLSARAASRIDGGEVTRAGARRLRPVRW